MNKATKNMFGVVWSDLPAYQKKSEMYAKKRKQMWNDYDAEAKKAWDKVAKRGY